MNKQPMSNKIMFINPNYFVIFIVRQFLNPDLSFPHIKLVPSIKCIRILVIPKRLQQTILSL